MGMVAAQTEVLRADIVGFDPAGDPVLVAEVRASELSAGSADTRDHLVGLLRAARPAPPYGMIAGPSEIRIWGWDGDRLSELGRLDAAAILRAYYPEFGTKRVFEDTLITLVEAWLRDVAFHWKLQTPPGWDQLTAFGLAAHLADGTTRTGVKLGRVPLP